MASDFFLSDDPSLTDNSSDQHETDRISKLMTCVEVNFDFRLSCLGHIWA